MYPWHASAPIYQQLAEQVVVGILDSGAPDGAALPSVRQLAKDYLVNPLTVSRAIECLRELGWIEARQGVGLFLRPGARQSILRFGRRRFLAVEWPPVREKVRRLGLSIDELCAPGPA